MSAQIADVDAMVHPAFQKTRLNPILLGNDSLVWLQHAFVHVRERAERHDLGNNPNGQVGELSVGLLKMLDEKFAGSPRFLTKSIQPIRMTEVFVEVGWVRVTKGPVALPELVGNGGPQIDFNNLQCLCEQIPQGKVELVRCYDIFECCSANEIMPLQFKCKTIATEAVVIQMGEELLRGLRISNRETTLLEQLDLSSVGKPRF